jgi:hypothetical protein
MPLLIVGHTYSVDTDGIGDQKDTEKGERSGLGAQLSGSRLNPLDTWSVRPDYRLWMDKLTSKMQVLVGDVSGVFAV